MSTTSPQHNVATVSPDGAWCWFSDPRAITRVGKIYTGWVTASGSIEAAVIDAAGSGNVLQTAVLHDNLEKDDHNNPSFLFLADGRLAAFYTTHGHDDMFLRITDKPGDISSWTSIRQLGFLDNSQGRWGITYANPVMLSQENNRIFVFFRGNNYKPTVAISTDQAQTWSTPREVISRPGETKNYRPYVKYSDNGRDRIDFLFTDGHPQNEPQNRVHYMRYEKGAFYKADGTKIGTLDDLPIDPEKADLIYDASAGRAWVWDLTVDAEGHPVLAYTRLPGDTNETIGRDHRYHVARWNGRTWIDTEIGRTDKWFPHTPPDAKETELFYSPGMALDPRNQNVAYYAACVNTRQEIFRATTPDAGLTWTSQPLTSNSPHDNIRPYVPRGTGSTSPVLWMTLRRYRHYTDYDASIQLHVPK